MITKQLWRKIALAVIGIIIIISIALGVFLKSFEPDKYKSIIETKLSEGLDRKVEIAGPIEWHLWPGFSLEVNELKVGDAASDQLAMEVPQARFKLSLIPLLWRKVDIASIKLVEPEFSITSDALPKKNLDELVAEHEQSLKASRQKPKADSLNLNIAKIELKQAQITYKNKRDNKIYKLQNLDFKAQNIYPNREAPFDLDFVLLDEADELKINNNLKFKLLWRKAEKELFIHKIRLNSKLFHPELHEGMPINFKSSLKYHLDTKDVVLESAQLTIFGFDLEGYLNYRNTKDDNIAQGHFALMNKDPKIAITTLGRILPLKWTMDDARKTNFTMDILKQNSAWQFNGIKGNFAGSKLTGKATFNSKLARPKLTMDMAVDTLNLDSFANPKQEVKTKSSAKDSATSAAAAPVADTNSLQLLRDFDADAKIKINRLVSDGFVLKTINSAVTLNKGKFNFKIPSADIYGGNMSSNIGINFNSKVPKFDVSKSVSNVPLKPIWQAAGKKPVITGTLSTKWNVRTQGMTEAQLMRNLNGSMNAKIVNGALETVDVPYHLDQADALLNKKAPTAKNDKRTQLDSITMTGNITAGVLRTKDLLVQGEGYTVSGGGKINMVAEDLDLSLSAKKTEHLKDKRRLPLALKVTGSWEDPTVTPDLDAYAKAAVEAEIDKQLDKQKDKVKEKLEEKLGDQLKDLIKF